jgi:hypothetical protein
MSITHNQSLTVNTNGSAPVSGKVSEVGNTEVALNVALAAGTTDQLQALTLTAANLQSLILVASQNLTIETNSGTTPAQTISLVAGIPLVWSKSAGYFANPITANVTALYLTCAAATVLQVKILTS